MSRNCAVTLGRLNVASWLLFGGAYGQFFLIADHLRGSASHAIGIIVALLPGYLIFAITLCKVPPPFGPRWFRRCLLFALCLYAILTAGAEILHAVLPPVRSVPHSMTLVARILMYSGFLCVVPYGRAWIALKRIESTSHSAESIIS